MKSILVCFFLLVTGVTFSQNAQVFAVHDGDSFRVWIDGDSEKKWIRLWGVDCPEVASNLISVDQPYARIVADSVRLLLKGKRVLVEPLHQDKYNRTVAKVKIDGEDLTEIILRKGWGWSYIDSHMSAEESDRVKSLHLEAKSSKTGLWGYAGVKLRPATWRKTYRR